MVPDSNLFGSLHVNKKMNRGKYVVKKKKEQGKICSKAHSVLVLSLCISYVIVGFVWGFLSKYMKVWVLKCLI